MSDSTSAMTSIGVIQSNQDSKTSSLTVQKRHISLEMIQEIVSKVKTTPGRASLELKAEHDVFSFKKTGDSYEVWLPSNLESFADNWGMICALCAITILPKCTVRELNNELDEFKVINKNVEYLHGLASAYRLKTINSDTTTGLYHHGMMWAVSFQLRRLKNWELVRTTWHTPFYPVLGTDVWTKNTKPVYQRWAALLKEAAHYIEVPHPENFSYSYKYIEQKKIKTTFAHESKAVFNDEEVSQMTKLTSAVRQDLENFKNTIRLRLDKSLIENFQTEYSKVAKRLLEYDQHISGIAQKRAAILYPKTNLGKQWKKQRLSRTDRVAMLDYSDRIRVENPMGLLLENRLETPKFDGDDLKTVSRNFTTWVNNNLQGFDLTSLTVDWIRRNADDTLSEYMQKRVGKPIQVTPLKQLALFTPGPDDMPSDNGTNDHAEDYEEKDDS